MNTNSENPSTAAGNKAPSPKSSSRAVPGGGAELRRAVGMIGVYLARQHVKTSTHERPLLEQVLSSALPFITDDLLTDAPVEAQKIVEKLRSDAEAAAAGVHDAGAAGGGGHAKGD